MQYLTSLRRYALALILLAMPGCDSAVQQVEVSGVVTGKGKPLAGIHLTFEPIEIEGAQPAIGRSNESGRFNLKGRVDGRSGAAVGRYRVMMTSIGPDQSGDDERAVLPKELVPMQYRDGSTIFEVHAKETNEANFSW